LIEIPEILAEQIKVNHGDPVEVYLKKLLVEQFTPVENKDT